MTLYGENNFTVKILAEKETGKEAFIQLIEKLKDISKKKSYIVIKI